MTQALLAATLGFCELIGTLSRYIIGAGSREDSLMKKPIISFKWLLFILGGILALPFAFAFAKGAAAGVMLNAAQNTGACGAGGTAAGGSGACGDGEDDRRRRQQQQDYDDYRRLQDMYHDFARNDAYRGDRSTWESDRQTLEQAREALETHPGRTGPKPLPEQSTVLEFVEAMNNKWP